LPWQVFELGRITDQANALLKSISVLREARLPCPALPSRDVLGHAKGVLVERF
jgi:hypothetical protein